MNEIESIKHRIDVAMERKEADIVFINGKVISTFTEEIIETEVAVSKGKIVALGYNGKAKEIVDLKGAYLAPSFIDSHIHIESSMLSIENFAKAVISHGTGTIISDPHEIVNVNGINAFEYMVNCASNLKGIDIFFNVPSCVPATDLETSGSKLTSKDIESIYKKYPHIPGLSEMMNYPGVYFKDPQVIEKIYTAHKFNKIIDGHSPLVTGKELNAYICSGISTDHECTNVQEAKEKLQRGMYVLIREGSAAQNLKNLCPLITDKTAHRICIATDDRAPEELIHKGHLDYTLNLLIQNKIDPLRAIRLMTLNPSLVYGLKEKGAIAPGYNADIVIFGDLYKPVIKLVYKNGEKVAKNGKTSDIIKNKAFVNKNTKSITSSVKLPDNLYEKLNNFPENGKVRAIEVIPGELVTNQVHIESKDVKDPDKDVAYMVVIERHGNAGNVGLGFVKGFGLKMGAIGSTIAHDSHNLIVAGKSIKDMHEAAQVIAKQNGGFAVVKDKNPIACVPLRIAGLMSNDPPEKLCKDLQYIKKAVRSLGITIENPLMTLSFLALPVIPHLKLTDLGLVDVDQFKAVPLVLDEDCRRGR